MKSGVLSSPARASISSRRAAISTRTPSSAASSSKRCRIIRFGLGRVQALGGYSVPGIEQVRDLFVRIEALPGAEGTTKRREGSAITMDSMIRILVASAREVPPNLQVIFFTSGNSRASGKQRFDPRSGTEDQCAGRVLNGGRQCPGSGQHVRDQSSHIIPRHKQHETDDQHQADRLVTFQHHHADGLAADPLDSVDKDLAPRPAREGAGD